MRTSVALTCFNGQQYLRQQLESILTQSMPVDEIVIGDDGSTDATHAIIAEFENNYGNKIRAFFNQKNCGTVKNLEKILPLCKGDIIFFADQDDVWHLDKVSRVTDIFDNAPNVLLIFTDAELIDSNGDSLGDTLWKRWNFTNRARRIWRESSIRAFQDLVNNNNKATGATMALRKKMLQYALPMELPDDYWHDAWFALHAAARRGLVFIEEPTIAYRVHALQQVGVTRRATPPSDRITYDKFRRIVVDQYPDLREVVDDPFYLSSDAALSKRFKHLLKISLRLRSKNSIST